MDEMTGHVDPNQLAEAPVELHRHPFRALFWSLLLGIGVALILIVTKVITLAIQSIVIVIVVVMVLGVLWGLFGPAKQPKGPVPVVVMPGNANQISRFDQVGDAGSQSTGPLEAPAPPAPAPATPSPPAPAADAPDAGTSAGGETGDDTAGSDGAKPSDS